MARSKKHATEGSSVPSDGTPGLASVEGLQNGGGSGVYIVERDPTRGRKTNGRSARKTMNPLLEHVTLVVYGWQNVEPGTLSWVFPSVGAAVAAARAMKNAVRWAIVAGRRATQASDAGELDEAEAQHEAEVALDEARAKGAVLIEQTG